MKWKVEEYHNHFEIWPDTESGAVKIIAKSHFWQKDEWKEEDRKNMTLIAAAPELYEACKRVIKDINTALLYKRIAKKTAEDICETLINSIKNAEGGK
jgi:hypothetical protein